MSSILVVTTGGTIDKLYFDALSDYRIGDSVVEGVLRTAQVACDVRIVSAMRKDSLDLTGEDRRAIRDLVAEVPERRVVVTHGTDTMVDTAAALGGLDDKVVALVGALSPARFAESDAAFNLGMAFAVVQVAPPGVWIAMNGTVFPADRVRKDRGRNRFVAV